MAAGKGAGNARELLLSTHPKTAPPAPHLRQQESRVSRCAGGQRQHAQPQHPAQAGQRIGQALRAAGQAGRRGGLSNVSFPGMASGRATGLGDCERDHSAGPAQLPSCVRAAPAHQHAGSKHDGDEVQRDLHPARWRGEQRGRGREGGSSAASGGHARTNTAALQLAA